MSEQIVNEDICEVCGGSKIGKPRLCSLEPHSREDRSEAANRRLLAERDALRAEAGRLREALGRIAGQHEWGYERTAWGEETHADWARRVALVPLDLTKEGTR